MLSVRDVQTLLIVAKYYNGAPDGDRGDKTQSAIEAILTANRHKLTEPAAIMGDRKRQMIAAAQLVLDAMGHEPGAVDGWDGHNTQEAFNAFAYERDHGKKEELPKRADTFPTAPAKEPASKKWGPWPKQADMTAFYGEAGNAKCTAGKIEFPLPMVIAWNTSERVNTARCHEKCAAAFTDIFVQTVEAYGESEFRALDLDKWGGCYNNRNMRGGKSKSTHAYGAAYDLNPEENQLRWNAGKAQFAKPKYDKYWKIVEAHGAVSLGRARDFDWMHVQLARL